MNLNGIPGFLDMFINLKEVIVSLRGKDSEFERQLAELRTQNLLLAQELTHQKERLARLEQRGDRIDAITTKPVPRLGKAKKSSDGQQKGT